MAGDISLSYRIITEQFTKGIARREARMPRAAMYSIREAGRVVKREAKAKAPVLANKSVVGAGAYRRAYRARTKKGVAGPILGEGGPVRGLLRQSIGSSRRLKQLGTTEFSLKVGPRGPRVYKYAGKIEDKAHYMQAGERAGAAALPVISQRAFDRVWKE